MSFNRRQLRDEVTWVIWGIAHLCKHSWDYPMVLSLPCLLYIVAMKLWGYHLRGRYVAEIMRRGQNGQLISLSYFKLLASTLESVHFLQSMQAANGRPTTTSSAITTCDENFILWWYTGWSSSYGCVSDNWDSKGGGRSWTYRWRMTDGDTKMK